MAVEAPTRLFEYLPAIYQADSSFLNHFLQVFEDILLGSEDSANPGLEEAIANISQLFDPLQTPDDFLPWLAQWTAFTLRSDLTSSQQRNFLANIIQLYRRRGTLANLQQFLQIFTVGLPVVEDKLPTLQVGVSSHIGVDTYLGNVPHYFRVSIAFPSDLKATVLQRQIAIAVALIELEKPAHTYYELKLVFPSMQVGIHSTIGIDSLLGTETSTNGNKSTSQHQF